MKLPEKLRHYHIRYIRLSASVFVALIAVVLVVVFLCSGTKPVQESLATPVPSPTAEPTPEHTQNEAKLQFAGDVALTQQLLQAGQTAAGYEFSSVFSAMKPYVDGDLAFFNMEGLLNGDGLGNYSGQPVYNYPEEIAAAASECGFNAAICANDQALNKGATGIYNTKLLLDANHILPVGTYNSKEEHDTCCVRDLNGIRVGVVAYTEALKSTSTDMQPYSVRTVQSAQREEALKKITQDMRALRAAGAEIVVVSLHWGQTTSVSPTDDQKWLAQNLAENGADIIYGTLPYTMQPVTYKSFTRTDGTEASTVVAYSLGNFLTHPTIPGNLATQESIVLNVRLARDGAGKAVISSVSYVPIYISAVEGTDGKFSYQVLPSAAYAEAETMPDGFSDEKEWKRCKTAYADVVKTITKATGNLELTLEQ